MELLRWQSNPWGQETLLGVSWDLLPWFAGAGALLIVTHIVIRLLWPPKRPRS